MIAAIVAAVFAFRASFGIRRVLLSVLATLFIVPGVFVFLLLHPELIDARLRTFKAFYHDIHEGMTRDEINSLLVRHYPKQGARHVPRILEDTSGRLGFLMNPEISSGPDCEGIFLTVNDGRVTAKKYVED